MEDYQKCLKEHARATTDAIRIPVPFKVLEVEKSYTYNAYMVTAYWLFPDDGGPNGGHVKAGEFRKAMAKLIDDAIEKRRGRR